VAKSPDEFRDLGAKLEIRADETTRRHLSPLLVERAKAFAKKTQDNPASAIERAGCETVRATS